MYVCMYVCMYVWFCLLMACPLWPKNLLYWCSRPKEYVCMYVSNCQQDLECMCDCMHFPSFFSNYSLSLFVGAQPKRQVGEDGEEHEHHHGEADGGECSPALLAQGMTHSPLGCLPLPLSILLISAVEGGFIIMLCWIRYVLFATFTIIHTYIHTLYFSLWNLIGRWLVTKSVQKCMYCM
jgi:hypothetical protein